MVLIKERVAATTRFCMYSNPPKLFQNLKSNNEQKQKLGNAALFIFINKFRILAILLIVCYMQYKPLISDRNGLLIDSKLPVDKSRNVNPATIWKKLTQE